MRLVHYILLSLALLSVSCEELIDVDLNDANPRYVIEAQLTDISPIQHIRVSETVPFGATVNSKPVEGATVLIMDSFAGYYTLRHIGNGIYEERNMKLVPGRTYRLYVEIGDQYFHAEQIMQPYVEIDSVGIVKERILNEDYYLPTFKFGDPQGAPNYYKYDMSVNGGDFKFALVFNDKFNDGLYVTHQVTDFDNEVKAGDVFTVRRHCINKSVYQYWNEFQSTNPGTAAPGNPTSNISNGALGYFSVSSSKEYEFHILDLDLIDHSFDSTITTP